MNSNEKNPNNLEQNNQTTNVNNSVTGNIQQMPTNQNIPINQVTNEINNQNINTQTPQNIPTQSQNVNNINQIQNNNNESHNLHQEENLKEVKITDQNSSKKGNLKYILTFILFIVLFALVYFLPDISEYINLAIANKKAEKNNVVITTGTLKCKLENSDSKLDYSYLALFDFNDSKLTKLTYTITTKGDETVDNEDLEKLNTECKNLETHTSSETGIIVGCTLNRGSFTKKQIFNYKDIDTDKITSIYAEAGGIYPEYRLDENIDTIEKNMKASGYSCERIK